MAAGSTYTPIATTTLGGATGSYTFSSIPSTYTDLEIVVTGTDTTLSAVSVQFNGDTGTNYSYTILQGNGTAAASSRASSTSSISIGVSDTTQFNTLIKIMNYSNTTTYKTVLGRGNDSAALVRANVGLWRSTAAINSVTVIGTSFQAGTVLTLYGIAAA